MIISPPDADARRAVKPVICYPVDGLPQPDMATYQKGREMLTKTDEAIAHPREAATFNVPAGHFFRITSVEGPQVGDLNLWNANDLTERFYPAPCMALTSRLASGCGRHFRGLDRSRPLRKIRLGGTALMDMAGPYMT